MLHKLVALEASSASLRSQNIEYKVLLVLFNVGVPDDILCSRFGKHESF